MHELLVELREGGRRGRRGSCLPEKGRQRLGLVASLHLLDVVDVGGVEELRPEEASANCVVERNTFLIPGGSVPVQCGPTTM